MKHNGKPNGKPLETHKTKGQPKEHQGNPLRTQAKPEGNETKETQRTNHMQNMENQRKLKGNQ